MPPPQSLQLSSQSEANWHAQPTSAIYSNPLLSGVLHYKASASDYCLDGLALRPSPYTSFTGGSSYSTGHVSTFFGHSKKPTPAPTAQELKFAAATANKQQTIALFVELAEYWCGRDIMQHRGNPIYH
jgi:hypothetical protein